MQTFNITLLHKKKSYFIAVGIFIVSSLIALELFNKKDCFISLNAFHSFWLNIFFINFTFLGDGIFAIGLIAVLFFYFKKKLLAISLLYSFLISGIIAQIIKNLVHAPRPKLFFETGKYLYFIDGVTHANNASFPSGHTATAFAIATVLVVMIKNRNIQFPVFFTALFVGYSRIYLAQHFLLDVVIGSFIGTISGVFSCYLASNFNRIKSNVGTLSNQF